MKTKEEKPEIKILNLDEVFKPLFDLIKEKQKIIDNSIYASDDFKGFM